MAGVDSIEAKRSQCLLAIGAMLRDTSVPLVQTKLAKPLGAEPFELLEPVHG